ncbi:MAG: superoxide dismutase [Clostridium sp.]
MKKFIISTLLLCLFLVPQSALANISKYELPKLPYAYDALEPYIDKETMEIHHDKHHRAYVNNLNAALDKHPNLFSIPLETLLKDPTKIPSDIRTAVINNGGGNYNHTLFWRIMTPNSKKLPEKELLNAINRDFGSFDNFKKQFSEAALTKFGSGWAFLVSDENGKLSIIQTSNQDTPLQQNLKPIILIDVWEHAYYLKYQNKRADYINNWWNVVNWDEALKNFQQ